MEDAKPALQKGQDLVTAAWDRAMRSRRESERGDPTWESYAVPGSDLRAFTFSFQLSRERRRRGASILARDLEDIGNGLPRRYEALIFLMFQGAAEIIDHGTSEAVLSKGMKGT